MSDKENGWQGRAGQAFALHLVKAINHRSACSFARRMGSRRRKFRGGADHCHTVAVPKVLAAKCDWRRCAANRNSPADLRWQNDPPAKAVKPAK